MKKRSLTIIAITLMAVLMLVSMETGVFAEDENYYEADGIQEREFDLKGNAESRTTSFFYKDGIITSFELIDPSTLNTLDPSIATASFKNNEYGAVYTITFNKEGKVYLKYKHERNGQSYESYMAINAKDKTYTCPIKSLKLGKINLNKQLGHSKILTGKAFKGKVTFKTKKGWKFISMSKYSSTAFDEGKIPKYIKLKKGKTVILKKGETIRIGFKKGKKIIDIYYKAE